MRVLISAYACEPDKGSEPGVGWNWALAAAERHEVWVLTRSNNREAIESDLGDTGGPALHFAYVDLPPRARAWKRGRVGLRVYYLLWQFLAAREARRLHRRHNFDVVHHLTFANVWLPALSCLAGPPFVLGPVGGGQKVPWRLYRALGPIGALQELSLRGFRGLVRWSPLTRVAWKRAAVILANNEETIQALPRRFRAKVVLRPNACTADELAARTRPATVEPVAVYAGRLNRFKGVELALRTIARLPDWKLVVVGDGPDARRLRRLAHELNVADRVRFEPWLAQRALWETMSTCRALLFPSLKEGAPSIVAEALALGLPVVAFDRGGSEAIGELAGARLELVPARSWDESIRGLADALVRIEENRAAPRPNLGRRRVADDLDRFYRQATSLDDVSEAVVA
jgi:glycosyltransferase involved in cell wall biosynthesis